MSFSFITALRSFHHHKKITTKLYADITYISFFFVNCSNRNHQNYVVVSRKNIHKNQDLKSAETSQNLVSVLDNCWRYGNLDHFKYDQYISSS